MPRERSQHHSSGTRIDRRRFLQAAGAGAALTATGLAGCTGGSGSGGGGGGGNQGGGGASVGKTGKPTLNLWLSYYTESKTKRQYTDKLMKQFEKETGIGITIQGVPYAQLTTKFRAAQAAGEVPHLVEVMTHPGIISSGAGMVVNDLWESSKIKDVVADSIMEGYKVWGAQATGQKGKLVTFPLGFRPYLSCWRTDWLKQANIAPEEVNYKAGSLNWYDDVVPIYEKLKQTKLGQKKGYYPDTTGMALGDQEYKSLYIPQHGGSLSGVVNVKGTKATIDTKEARKAISMYWDFVDKGYFNPNSINTGDEQSTTLHWAGKIADNHIQDSSDLWTGYREQQPQAFKNGLYTWGLPMNASQKAALAWLPAMGFMESAFTSQAEKDAAVKLLDWWIADPKRAVDNARNLGFVPVFPKAIEQQPFFGKTKRHEEFWRGACATALKEITTAVIPAVPSATAITYDIPRKMDQQIHQGMSIEKATAQAADEINQLLQRSA